MKEPWIVFYFQDKEVCAITVHGTFPGEGGCGKERMKLKNCTKGR